MSNVLYIINPAGHGGSGMKVWEEFKSLWPDPINSTDVIVTERPGHAREIAAARSDYAILACVGGDGTVGEVISGVMDRSGPMSNVAIIPCGTGNDIGRNTGVFSVSDSVAALREGHVRKFDLIRINCQVDGREVHSYAFLVATVGFCATLMVRPWMKRYLGPKGAYYLGAILGIITYRVPRMTVRWEDQEYSGRVWVVYAANVERTSGGSMCIAPGAQPDDGDLRVTIMPTRSKLHFLTKMMPKVGSGQHVRQPGVLYFSTKEIEVDCEQPGTIEVDGDIFGSAPATLSICPKAVEIMCPPQSGRHAV